MNTPAHILTVMTVLDKRRSHGVLFLETFIPDLPMFLLFFYEKFILKIDDSVIWNGRYFDPNWQNFFNIFNSIPFILLTFCGCFLLHQEDSHRHLYPLSDFRFFSPVSYFNPNHYGNVVVIFEMLLSGVYLWRKTIQNLKNMVLLYCFVLIS